MRSRQRLSLQLQLAVASLLLLAAAVAVWQLDRWLEEGLDAILLTQARTVSAFATLSPEGEIQLASDRLPPSAPLGQREYFQLWSGEGRCIVKSISLADGRRLRSDTSTTPEEDLPRDVVPAREPRFNDILLPEGRAGRSVQIDFEVPIRPATTESAFAETSADGSPSGAAGTEPSASDSAPTGPQAGLQSSAWPPHDRHRLATLVVAQSRQPIDRRTRRFAATLAVVGTLLLALIHWLHRRALHLALRPLNQVTEQMAAMGARNLKRLQVEDPPRELSPLVDRLNVLLDGLEQALARERRLSSNIAHELRTPIAELRNLAEVGSRWPEKQAMVLQFFSDVNDISHQMEKTVTHLLALARYESGLEIVRHSNVRLLPLVEQAWRPQVRAAAAKGIVLAPDVPAETKIRSDADKLQLMVANLLSNAVQYSPDGSTIRCRARCRNGDWSLAVINPAEHLQPEDIPLLFDRFWRKEEARTGGEHSGLGLSLVRAFGDLLGIDVRARLDARHHLHIELRGVQQPTTASVAEFSALRVD